MTVRVNVCVKEKAVCTGRACVLHSKCCLQAGNVCFMKGKEAPHLVNTAHNIILHKSLIYTLFCLRGSDSYHTSVSSEEPSVRDSSSRRKKIHIIPA